MSWLKENKAYPIEDTLLDLAHTTMQFNVAKEVQELGFTLEPEITALIS